VNLSAQKRRETAAANAIARGEASQAAFLLAHPELAAINSEALFANSFLQAMRGVIHKYGQLTPAQLDAVGRCLVREQEFQQARQARETARAEKAASSRFQGVVGVRQEWSLVVVKEIALETQFGQSYLYLMEDAGGNQFKWFASNRMGIETDAGFQAVQAGERVTLKGTVKAHEIYKGAQQTGLTRCKLLARVEAQAA